MPDDRDWRQDRYAPFAGESVRGADAWEPSGIGPNATTQPLASGQLPPPRIVDADAPANQPRRRGVSRRLVLATAAAGSVALGAGAGLGWWSTHHGGQAAPAVAQQMSHLLRRAGFGMRPSEAAAYAALGFNAAVDRLLDPASVADPLESQLASDATPPPVSHLRRSRQGHAADANTPNDARTCEHAAALGVDTDVNGGTVPAATLLWRR
jgi:hypothetical protein